MLLRKDLITRRRSAFTLMEMLVVVAIIVALAGIGGFFLMGALRGGQRSTAEAQTKVLTQACQAYAINHQGNYPDQLATLLQKDQDTGYGPYLDNPDALKDPWGQFYQYDKSGQMNQSLKPDIWTIDPQQPGLKIGNWSKTAQQGGAPR